MFEEQFVINEEIGRGGMGRVYGGVHIKTQTPVVLKTTIESTAQWSSFEQEARAAARLHHPNIVETYDYGILERAYRDPQIDAGMPYLIMARLPLMPLSSHLPRLGIPAIQRVIEAIFDALAHAHARGVIHRDLKPGNVLADVSGERVVLIDFGLSSLRHEDNRASGGTPLYMAPEQYTDALGDGEGPWTDLYALGCMIFEMVSGYPPFLATTRDQLFEQKWANRHQPWPQHVPNALQMWVARLMAREPAERFSHVAHAQAAYRDIQWTTSDAPAPMISMSAFASTAWSIAQQPMVTGLTSDTPEIVEHVTIVIPPDYPETPAPPEPLVDLGVSLFQHREVPLIGRRDAQQALWHKLKQTIDTQRAHAVMIDGFAGLGKTALLRQLKHHAHSTSGLDTLTLTHEGNLQQTLADALDHHFDTHHLPDRSAVLAKLQRRLGGRVDGQRHARALLDVMRPGQQQLEDTPLLDRLIDWLLHTPTPMIVMMDNVQWWSRGSEQWHHIIHRLSSAPLFFVLARRHEQDTRDFEATSTIELAPLSDDEQAEFIRQWLCFEPDIIDAICQRTGGNPFFAHQVIQDWITQGVLVPASRGFVLDEHTQAIIPESVQALLGQRLDHLDDPVRELLLRCALMGNTLNATQWHTLTETHPLEAIGTLQRQGLIEPAQAGVRFVHNIVQEYIVNTTPDGPALRQAHADCARTFDTLPFKTPTQNIQHHHHLLHSQQYEQMFDKLADVAGSATYEQGLNQCDATEAYLQHHQHFTSQHQIKLQCWRIAVYANHLRSDEAIALDADVRDMLEQVDDLDFVQQSLRLLDIILIMSLVHQGDELKAEQIALSLLAQITQLSNKMKHSLYLHLAETYTFREDGQQALHYLKFAQSMAHNIWDEAWVYYGQAMAYDELGQLDDGLLACDEAQKRFEQLEDAIGIASCELVRGFLLCNAKHYDLAQQHFQRSQEMYGAVGDPAQWYAVEGTLMCLIMQNEFDAATAILAQIQQRRDAGEDFDARVELFIVACHIHHQQWSDALSAMTVLQNNHDPDQYIVTILQHMQPHLMHCTEPSVQMAFEQCLQWSTSEAPVEETTDDEEAS